MSGAPFTVKAFYPRFGQLSQQDFVVVNVNNTNIRFYNNTYYTEHIYLTDVRQMFMGNFIIKEECHQLIINQLGRALGWAKIILPLSLIIDYYNADIFTQYGIEYVLLKVQEFLRNSIGHFGIDKSVYSKCLDFVLISRQNERVHYQTQNREFSEHIDKLKEDIVEKDEKIKELQDRENKSDSFDELALIRTRLERLEKINNSHKMEENGERELPRKSRRGK